MAARKALAAQIDQKMLWPRERRWLLDLNTNDMAARKALAAQTDQKMLWPRERRWPLNLITKRYWPRKNRRSYHAPTASISRAGRIVRRQLPYRAPVVSRANSFFSAAGRIARQQLL